MNVEEQNWIIKTLKRNCPENKNKLYIKIYNNSIRSENCHTLFCKNKPTREMRIYYNKKKFPLRYCRCEKCINIILFIINNLYNKVEIINEK